MTCKKSYRNLSLAVIIAVTSIALVSADMTASDDIEVTDTPVTQLANYGEPCSSIGDCDSAAYLACVNGTCDCALSSMKFDDTTSSCWVLPGEKCIYRASEMGSVLAEIATAEERTAHLADRVSLRCIKDGVCEDGHCVCDTGRYATPNGTCELQREIGESCDKDSACRTSLHLICNENKECGCDETKAVYDNQHGLCVGLTNSSCFEFELCVDNAYCPSYGIFNQYDVKCTCKPGYYETPERNCKPKESYGGDCTVDDECREDFNLACDQEQGKCVCNSITIYDSTEGKCMSKVNSPCSESIPCIPNADCQHSGFHNGNILERRMTCKCSNGFFETEEKTCERQKEYESQCVDDSHCKNDFVCNRFTGLCSCNETTQTYDRSRRRCISLAGTNCERNDQCVINAICRSPGYLYPRHSPKAECICKDGFHKTSDGYCLGKYGSRCETWTNSCKESLKCQNFQCTCDNFHQYYDYSMEKCLTYVGTTCDNTTTCVQHAFCGEENKCRCYDGFMTLDGGRMCVALAGQKCSEGDDQLYIPCTSHARCDAGFCKCGLAYFTTANNTCQRKGGYGEYCTSSDSCEDNYCDLNGNFCSCNPSTSMFDPTRKTCMRLAGANCHDLRDCVPNALCQNPARLSFVDMNSKCSCKEGYYKSQNSTCEWKRGYMETCTEDAQCQDAADLVCSVQGRCECNSTVSAYDEVRKTCLRLAGAPCSSHQHCISHAKCRNPLYWIHYETFSPNARCECDSSQGYTNSSDGKCIIDYYGGKCDISLGQHCSSKFVCADGKCLCPYEDHQVYDEKKKTCISLVKGPCDNSTNLCVKNSHCLLTEEGVPECRCKHGFIAVDRMCELTFGQPCSTRSQKRSLRLYVKDVGSHRSSSERSEIDEEPRCDRLGPLKCLHGTCQCGGFQFYDYELQKCRGLVGSRCDSEVKSFCSEGATCEAYRGLPLTSSLGESKNITEMVKKRYGRCKCMEGFVAEADRSCRRIIL